MSWRYTAGRIKDKKIKPYMLKRYKSHRGCTAEDRYKMLDEYWDKAIKSEERDRQFSYDFLIVALGSTSYLKILRPFAIRISLS